MKNLKIIIRKIMGNLKIKIYAWLFYKVAKISKTLANKMIGFAKKEDADFYQEYYKDQKK